MASRTEVAEAVAWVMDNYEKVVSDSNGRIVLSYDKATSEPPRLGRVFMRYASRHWGSFVDKTVSRYIDDDNEAIDEEDVKRDKKSVEEIEKVLLKYKELAREA